MKKYNMSDHKKMTNVVWTPELVEIVRNLKPFDYKHDDEKIN